MSGRLELTAWQRDELLRYADGEPHRGRPSRNLIRRNLVTLAPASGTTMYRITELGRAALAEARRTGRWPGRESERR